MFVRAPKAAELFSKMLEEAKPEAMYTSSSRRFMILIMNAESHEELFKVLGTIWYTMKVYPKVDTVMNMSEWKEALANSRELFARL